MPTFKRLILSTLLLSALLTLGLLSSAYAQDGPNQPPRVELIPTQRVQVGQSLAVIIDATDPEGFNTFLAEVISGSDAIVRAVPDGQGNIRLTGVSVGQVSILVRISDGEAVTTLQFTVIVTPPPSPVPNQPPVIEPINQQTVPVGETLTVPVEASDPEGTQPFIVAIESGSEAIATGEPDGEGNLLIQGISPGQVNFRLSVQDGDGAITRTVFVVVVASEGGAGNQPPSVAPISNQRLALGETLRLDIDASDPEGFNPFLSAVRSSASEIVTATANNDRSITLEGISPGTANVTVTVDDGNGAQASLTFSVTVGAAPTSTPNAPPSIQPIPDQNVRVGERLTVFVTATDPEGFNTFIADLSSASTQIASVERDGQGNIILNGVSPGRTTVSFLIDDGRGGQAPTSFDVVVMAQPTAIPNQPPTLAPILDQVLRPGQGVTVFIDASDPEGFNPFLAEVRSASGQIATAESDGEGNVTVTGVSPGETSVLVIVDDGNGGQTQGQFQVTVVPNEDASPSAPPELAPIPNQVLTVDTFSPISVDATDPEGAPVSLSVSSSNESVVATQLTPENGGITLYGANLGQATITLSADDGDGNLSAAVFGVTVVADPNAPVYSALPIFPDLSGPLLENLQTVYQFSDADPNSLMVIGFVPPSELLAGAFSDAGYDLSFDPNLESVLLAYQDSLDAGSLSSNPEWTLADVLDPALSGPDCGALSPLECALDAHNPAVALIFAGLNEDRLSTIPSAFETQLNGVVGSLLDAGVIPVITTLPDPDNIAEAYNTVLVGVAAANNVPLWNLARDMPANLVNDDLSLVTAPDDQRTRLTAENVGAYGDALRNLRMLQLLDALRTSIPLE